MKKALLLLSMALLTTSTLYAQISSQTDATFAFVDESGTVVADGSTLNLTTIVDDEFEGKKINSGLYVKNVSSTAAYAGLTVTILDMQSGNFQHCFPGSCKKTSAPATNDIDSRTPTETDVIAAGEKKSLQSEWFIVEGTYGTTTVTYQIKVYEKDATTQQMTYKADGPTVTVNYVYADPSVRMYMGPYSSDDLSSSGLGATGLSGYQISVGAALKADYVKKFNGWRVIGIRFGLAYSAGTTKVFINEINNGTIGSEVVSQSVSSTTTGWNEVTLDTPYTISADGTNSFLIGYDYAQTASSSTGYPLLAYGTGYDGCFYMNYNGTWNSQGTSLGCLSVQCIVQSPDGKYTDDIVLDAVSVEPYRAIGSQATVKITCHNFSPYTAENCNFIVSVNGKTTASLTKSVSSAGETFSESFVIDSNYSTGEKYDVDVYVKSVNGKDPAGDTSDDKLSTSFTVYGDTISRQKQLVEQFTGTWCGYCPLGTAVLEALSEKRNDIAWVGIHCGDSYSVSNYYAIQNALYVSGYPSAAFNRSCEEGNGKATYTISYSSTDYTANRFNRLINNLNAEHPNFVSLDIDATYDDNNQLTIKVKGTGAEKASKLIGDDGKLTVYVTEDGLSGTQYSASAGAYEDATHNKVLRAIVSSPTGDNISWNGDDFECDYTLTLDNSWVKSNMHVVAFVGRSILNKTDYTDMWVYNTNMATLTSQSTGISSVCNADEIREIARYTLDGQQIKSPTKGINIVKMSDGSTRKVIVK